MVQPLLVIGRGNSLEKKMKTIETKQGNRTVFKIVPDDYVEEPQRLEQKDLTTSGRKSLGYSDISTADWNRIFKHGETDRETEKVCSGL